LVSDGYLSLKKSSFETEEEVRAQRFFMIAKRVPLEIQMIMCRRIFLSSKTFILANETEAALRKVLSFQFDE